MFMDAMAAVSIDLEGMQTWMHALAWAKYSSSFSLLEQLVQMVAVKVKLGLLDTILEF